MTHAEAARHLGCPPGTVATRLSRARDQLRARLVRRGVTLSAGVLAAALIGGAEASVPPALFGGILRALVSSSAFPAHVTALVEGVCRTMLMEKLRFVVMAVVAATAVGALVLGYRSGAAEPPVSDAPPTVPVAPAQAGEKDEAAGVVRTKNFLVMAPNARIARLIAEAAERHRKEKAILWLGVELPAWADRCAIKVKIVLEGKDGATTFEYGDGKVARRDMRLEGSLERLLSGTLPHEVTHTVFADFFGQPVPRWADEGGAVLSEDEEEQQRHTRLLREKIEKDRLIPLSRLLKLKEYPDDVAALYVEGHSLTGFLVERKDHKTFLGFVKQGMKGDWDKATKEHYGFRDVKELEQAWLKEVRKEPKAQSVVEYGMPVERTGLPEEGPLPGVARLQPDGKGVVLEVIRTKIHYRMTAIRERDGSRTSGGLRPLVKHATFKIDLPFSEVKAYRTDGTEIDAKKLPDLLKKETSVLVALDRSVVHQRWLQLVKEDTLVIVMKATELQEKKEETPAPGGQ
jgi:Sigma-70, region 4